MEDAERLENALKDTLVDAKSITPKIIINVNANSKEIEYDNRIEAFYISLLNKIINGEEESKFINEFLQAKVANIRKSLDKNQIIIISKTINGFYKRIDREIPRELDLSNDELKVQTFDTKPFDPQQGGFDFLEELPEGHPFIKYSPEKLPKINETYNKLYELVNEQRNKIIMDSSNLSEYSVAFHETGSIMPLLTMDLFFSFLKGRELPDLLEEYVKSYKNHPIKLKIIGNILPAFCDGMNLDVNEIMNEWKKLVPKYVLVVDDSLDMDLKAKGINCSVDNLFADAKPPVIVIHAKNKEEAILSVNEARDEQMEFSAVICDYKLHVAGEDAVWGDRLLNQEIIPKLRGKPKIFLTSKSGFRQEDINTLKVSGIEYAHGYELPVFAAFQTNDNQKIRLATELPKTSNLREWINTEFATNYPTQTYIAPNIADSEKGNLSIKEVVKRNHDGASFAEICELLNPQTISSVFNVRVEGDNVSEEEKITISPGIKGRSFQGKLSLSDAGVRITGGDGSEIMLVIDHDYSPKDDSLISESNIKGLVLLKKGTNHIQTLANNNNIPVAFARSRDSAILEVENGELYITDRELHNKTLFAKEGDEITFDGEKFILYKGKQPLIEADDQEKQAVRELVKLAQSRIGDTWHTRDEKNNILPDMHGVRVAINIDTPQDLSNALETNIDISGVGLFRTERGLGGKAEEYISGITNNKDGYLENFREHNRKNFADVFEQIKDKDSFPVTVRLLDFDQELRKNHPEIYKSQCEVLFEEAVKNNISPRILIPSVSYGDELESIITTIRQVSKDYNCSYEIGTMLENQAILKESELGKVVDMVDFVSFGLNDLTEDVTKLKRGDFDSLFKWQNDNRFPFNPYNVVCDEVKEIVTKAQNFIRSKKPIMRVNICGEQANDYRNYEFFQENRINTVSVSPNEEAISKAIIASGSEVARSYGKTRNVTSQEESNLSEIDLPEKINIKNVLVPNKHIYSPTKFVFLCLEDDKFERTQLVSSLKNQPIVFAENIADALEFIEQEGSKKEIIILSDITLPIGNLKKLEHKYNWTNLIAEGQANGEAFVNAIKRGEITGVNKEQVIAYTAGDIKCYNLDEGITVLEKNKDIIDTINKIIENKKKALRLQRQDRNK